MEKIKKYVMHWNHLGIDKLKHFYIGALLFAFIDVFLDDIWASVITCLIAIAKEVLWDSYLGRGKLELLDAVMSILPVLLYWLVRL